MQGQVRLALAALLLGVALAAGAADAELAAEVPAEQWKALRLTGLTKNSSLAVRVETTGPIRVILARQDEAERFPKGVRPAFSGTAQRRLSFRLRLPSAGTYYVILDNREGDAARDVKLFIRALPPRPAQKPAPAAPAQPGLNAT